MAKITRYTGNVLAPATNAIGTERTVFGDTTQSDTLDNNLNTDLLRGWGIVSVNENPTKQDFNALAFTLGQLIAYLHQAGVAEYDAAQEYFAGGLCQVSGQVYISQVNGNIGNNPTGDDGTNWHAHGLTQVNDLTTLGTITGSTGRHVYTKYRATAGDGGGGLWRWDGSNLAAEVAADTRSGIYKAQDGDNGTNGAWVRSYTDAVDVRWFGASVATTSAENTAAHQGAIDYVASIGGGQVRLINGTVEIGTGGIIDTRPYGLLMKSGVSLVGGGSKVSTIRAANATEMDVITTERLTSVNNIGLFSFGVDGNEANQVDGRLNFWLDNCDNVIIHDVYSTDPGRWGFRLESITNLKMSNIQTDHSNESNADGVHIIDCSYATINNVVVDTLGDDGFVIEARTPAGCHDIAVSNLVVTSGPSRGVTLFVDDTIVTDTCNIYNVAITNARIYSSGSSAFNLLGANFYNVSIEGAAYGCRESLSLIAGIVGFAADIRNCSFTIKDYDSTEYGMFVTLTNGAVENNYLNFSCYNPGDGFVGLQLQGDYWTGEINVDYDPNGTKVSPTNALDVYGSYNNLSVTTDNGDAGINVRLGADYNTFRLGAVLNAVTNSVKIASGVNNTTIIGGRIDVAPADSGNATEWINVAGASARDRISLSPDVSGDAVIPHGLLAQPAFARLNLRGPYTQLFANVFSLDGTNITVRFTDTAGNAVTTGTYVVVWEAALS